jgi:hypothetical protein
MTYKEVQKAVKLQTDNILSQFDGNIELGGNIFHKRQSDSGVNIIFQSILKYDTFPISCSLMISNNEITNLYFNAINKKTTENLKIDLPISILNIADSFEIKNEDDVYIWINTISKKLNMVMEENFRKFSKIEILDKHINQQLELIDEVDFIADDFLFNIGLVSTKLVNPNNLEINYDKIKNLYIKNDFPENTQFQTEKIYSYLKNI